MTATDAGFRRGLLLVDDHVIVREGLNTATQRPNAGARSQQALGPRTGSPAPHRGGQATDIAAALHLSVKTVSTHKSRIQEQLDLA